MVTHAGNNPKQQRQHCHPLSLPLGAHLDVSLRFTSGYISSRLRRLPSSPLPWAVTRPSYGALTARLCGGSFAFEACARTDGQCPASQVTLTHFLCVWPHSCGCMKCNQTHAVNILHFILPQQESQRGVEVNQHQRLQSPT